MPIKALRYTARNLKETATMKPDSQHSGAGNSSPLARRQSSFGRASMWRDFGAIVIATLTSFIGGEVLNACGWFGLLS